MDNTVRQKRLTSDAARSGTEAPLDAEETSASPREPSKKPKRPHAGAANKARVDSSRNLDAAARAVVRGYLASRRASKAEAEARLSEAYRRISNHVTEADPRFQLRALLDILGPYDAARPPANAHAHRRSFGLAGAVSRAARRGVSLIQGQYRSRQAFEAQVNLVLQSELFDSSYYRRQIGLPTHWGARQLVVHYLHDGAAAGLDPHPLFDTSFYLEENKDLAGSSTNPFVHFLSHGSREDRDPHPLFDIRYYRSRVSGLRPLDPNPVRDYLLRSWDERLSTHQGLVHPMFVDSYYVRVHPEVLESELSPLEHFVLFGAARRWNPSALFDTEYYESQLDLTKTSLRGVFHYRMSPNAERKNPHPLFDLDCYFRQLVGGRDGSYEPLRHYVTSGGADGFRPHPLFDSGFYWAQIADAEGFDGTPLEHYLAHGRHFEVNPHPLFNTHWYALQAPEAIEEGGVPLLDYLDRGAALGLSPHPLFSGKHYLSLNDDVRRAKLNPLVHYVLTGGAEERSPHPLFDSSFYYEHYADVAELGVNPLMHYLRYGLSESRQPCPQFDPRFYLRNHPRLRGGSLTPLEHYVTEGWLLGYDPHPEFSSAFYLAHCVEARRESWEPLAHYLLRGRALGLRTMPEDTTEYHRWYRRHGVLTPEAARAAKRWLSAAGTQPPVSVIADETALGADGVARLLRSLERQLSEAWQLVLAVPGTGAGAERQTIGADPRVVRVKMPSGLSMEDRLLRACAEASGEWLWICPGPAELAREAIALVGHAAAEDPSLAAVFGDWDRIGGNRLRTDPCFNPAWNRELFLSHDTVTPAVFVSKRELMEGKNEALGLGERLGRLLLSVDPQRIARIPARLVSYREGAASARLDGVQRGADGWARAQGASVGTHPAGNGFAIVRFPIPEPPPLVSIVVPTKDQVALLQTCIESLLTKTTYPSYEVLVVDNRSEKAETMAYFESLRREPRVRVVPYPKPYNYSAMNNEAAQLASGSLLCFMNNDIEVLSPEWLTDMVRHGVREGAGAVGARLFFPNGTVQHAGVVVGMNGSAGNVFTGLSSASSGFQGRAVATQELSAVTAACMLVPRAAFDAVGGFDAEHLSISFNDIDLCLRLREAGKRVIYAAEAELYHHESASIGTPHRKRTMFRFDREILAFKTRWARTLRDDPFYHPSLSLGPRPYAFDTRPRWRAPWSRPNVSAPSVARSSRDSRLAPYADMTNLERSYAVVKSGPRRVSCRERTPGLSIAILTLDKPELIIPLLRALAGARRALEAEGTALQILVGDTGSTDASVLAAYSELAADVEVVRGMRYQFSRCNNDLFFERVEHDTVLFLNNDVRFADATASLRMLRQPFSEDAALGIVGTVLRYPDGSLQHAGIEFFREGPLAPLCYHARHGEALPERLPDGVRYDVPAVTGACLLIRSGIFEEAGGFDEEYRTECQDVALCLAARRLGFRSAVICAGEIEHLENATRPKGSEDWADRRRFLRKWGSFIGGAFA